MIRFVRDTSRKVSALAGGKVPGELRSHSHVTHSRRSRPLGAALSICGSLMRVSLKIDGLAFVPTLLSAEAMPVRPVDRTAMQDKAVGIFRQNLRINTTNPPDNGLEAAHFLETSTDLAAANVGAGVTLAYDIPRYAQ